MFVIFSISCLLFSQYFSKSKSPHFSEKSFPELPRLEPHRKVNATGLERKKTQTFKTLRKTANLFSNLDFLPKSGFPKTLDLSMDFPRISHPKDFPPHGFWIFGEAAGAADKNQDWTYRGVKNCMFGQTKYFAPYGDSGRFDTTEWSGNRFCVEIDPASPIFCLTE